jgi:hypothetical protein
MCGSLVLGPVSTAYFYSKAPEFVPRHRSAVLTDSCLGLSQDNSPGIVSPTRPSPLPYASDHLLTNYSIIDVALSEMLEKIVK